MKPKLVILFGGPRPEKNTDQALDLVLSGISIEKFDVTRFDLRKMKIHPCTGCYHCAESGRCVFRDDMDLILKAVNEADGVILATPFYFNSVSALTKTMIDRFQVKWTSKFMLKERSAEKSKKGLLLVTAGAIQKKNESDGARLVAELFFKSIRSTFDDFLFIEGTDSQPVSEQLERHSWLRETGERFSEGILAALV
ncbi:flavodoxin family protein [Acidaminobacter hydrogenoformans]|uniref:NADPH-dependent FMN reductase n=1 Tax=Acidaminobacter hydrogenoformans DSM 2784 TaxID=1120920 RepID=A0A1G5RTB2_9FIRM|nr:flavodoxin family protein [Acidaminobacter hydrogenoformans]SCZ77078.1 NADPH-dependent FMN reductase [Acidaminobacter hydrogenoformans DSM 2784]